MVYDPAIVKIVYCKFLIFMYNAKLE